MSADPSRADDSRVEPLLAALEERGLARSGSGPGSRGPRLGWRILWAALVLLALVALVLKQAF